MIKSPIILCIVLLAASCDLYEDARQSGVLRTTAADITTCGPSLAEAGPLEIYQVKPIGLIPEALGKYRRTITTREQEAQAFFNQGIQLKYAFAINEAISSFREAQKIDSTCAMCFWGEAWALGSYLNGHMRANKAPLALAAINKASDLANADLTPVEQQLIEAMQVRYIADYDYEKRRHQDSVYANEMEGVFDRFGDDHDVATIYAEALFLLEPRGGTREMTNPRLQKIHSALEGVLDENTTHPGACHLYIHATESTNNPGLAESCADYLGNTIPGASHINHMPSHTYNEIGRWGDAVRANLQAFQTDQRANDGTAIAIYPGHNLHMLMYAAAYDGQGAIAIQAGKDFAKLDGNTVHQALALTRFGRFDEVLELKRPGDDIISVALWEFCHGYAHAKSGELDFANLYLKRVQKTADTTSASFRWQEGAPILQVVATILEGEMLWQTGAVDQAIEVFKRGVELEDKLPYSEPEPLPFSIRHWLGAAQLSAGLGQDAATTFRDEIEDHPRNGWSLYGLKSALEIQAKNASDVTQQLTQSWARADTRLSSSRF